ncbi:hypothetical protein [Nocardia sp. CA-120079]|uniref:hypothetical protein n=1 Tax=Nocardia sp. CA-120079 TaxID=3239974 RepID=UPI003D991A84
MADNNSYGQLVRWRAYLPCPGCPGGEHVDLAPGRLSPDGTVEIRTCPECGTEIPTEPRFTCPPGEATDWLE